VSRRGLRHATKKKTLTSQSCAGKSCLVAISEYLGITLGRIPRLSGGKASWLDDFQDIVKSAKSFRESVTSRSAPGSPTRKERRSDSSAFAFAIPNDSSLGKAIREEQRTDELGASAMWRPCFCFPCSCFSRGHEKNEGEDGVREADGKERNAFINTAESNKTNTRRLTP